MGDSEDASPSIDSHQHFWDPGRRSYPWMAREGWQVLARPYGPQDLEPELRRAKVHGTVLVQAVASADETEDFLGLCAENTFVRGVVGWVDLSSAGVGETIDRLRCLPGGDRLVGVRHQVEDEPDPDWLSRPEVRRGLAAVAERGLAFDLLVHERHLSAAVRAVCEMEELRFVLDHLGKPPILSGLDEQWRRGFAQLAQPANAYAKVSGLVTQADVARWRPSDLRPYVELALECFGPHRLMWGSDWPVCLLAAPYGAVLGTARSLLGEIAPSERQAVFGGTATRVYKLASEAPGVGEPQAVTPQ